jgi:hypothetical protein
MVVPRESASDLPHNNGSSRQLSCLALTRILIYRLLIGRRYE